jgi:carboxymethylenebutenolidase
MEVLTIRPAALSGEAGLALPSAESGPGLVLAPGRVGDARDVAPLYAEEGYVVLCPHDGGGERDLGAAVAALRERAECTGDIAVLAFAEAGIAALRAAADGDVAAAVCYDPAGLDGMADLVSRIGCPTALHIAEHSAAGAADALRRIKDAAASRRNLAIHVYPGTRRGFAETGGADYDRAAAGIAHSRSIALLRRAIGPDYDLETLWEAHTRYEFVTRDVDATMATMVAEPYVNHVPVMTGGVGQRDLARFYANHFIPKCPADITMVPVSRTIGADRIVDEMIVSFTHDVEIDWMLPGVAPTGRRVEVPLVAIVGFRGDKLYHEHIYWDQASVLVQIGLLDPSGLPVAGAEIAKKLLDETLPSNTLMRRQSGSAPKDG